MGRDKGSGLNFWEVYESFLLPLRWKSIFRPRTAFLIMVRVETFFLLTRLPPPTSYPFF